MDGTLDTQTIVLICTAAFIVLTLVWTAVRWSTRQSVRSLLRGLGLAVLAAGAWLTGVLDMGGNGVESLIDWANRQVLDRRMMVGLGIAGTGVLLWVIANFVKPVTRAMAKERRAARAANPAPAVSPGRGAVPAVAAPAKAPVKALGKASVDPEDAEIEALLKSRGIE